MKPITETNRPSAKRDSFASRATRRMPVTDCNYHSVALGGFNRASSAKNSFRSISNDYFKNEARYDFVTEAAYFVAIVLTAAVPLISGVFALLHFARATGGI